MSKKSHHFLMLWPWPLTYDLEKLIRSGHYHYQCVYQIWEQSIQWFLSYRVNTIAGGGRLRRKTITSPDPSDTGDIINNIPALVQIMAWRRPDDKPLSEPMMVSLLTHICVTRPQWVKWMICCTFPVKLLLDKTGSYGTSMMIFKCSSGNGLVPSGAKPLTDTDSVNWRRYLLHAKTFLNV